MIAQVFKREHVEFVARVELHISQMLWLSWLRFGVIYMFEVKTNEAKRWKEWEGTREKGTVCAVCTYVCLRIRSAQKRKDTRRFRQFNKQFCLICYCMYVCASSSRSSSSSSSNKRFGTPVRNRMWNDTQPSDTCNREHCYKEKNENQAA